MLSDLLNESTYWVWVPQTPSDQNNWSSKAVTYAPYGKLQDRWLHRSRRVTRTWRCGSVKKQHESERHQLLLNRSLMPRSRNPKKVSTISKVPKSKFGERFLQHLSSALNDLHALSMRTERRSPSFGTCHLEFWEDRYYIDLKPIRNYLVKKQWVHSNAHLHELILAFWWQRMALFRDRRPVEAGWPICRADRSTSVDRSEVVRYGTLTNMWGDVRMWPARWTGSHYIVTGIVLLLPSTSTWIVFRINYII